MQAVLFDSYGGPEVLRLTGAPDPVPGPGEVRLRVAASAFNPLDAGLRAGYLRDAFPLRLPHIPGYDVAGTVETVGDGVVTFDVGDEVVAFLSMTADGAAAELVVAPADVLVAAPTRIPLSDAAALPSAATTAWQTLVDSAGLSAGQRVLINGAGGTVGGFAVQLAKHVGAHVIATSRPDSLERLKALGADDVVEHTDEGVTLTEPVDVLLNLGPVGAEQLAALTSSVRSGGVVVNTVPSVTAVGDDARGVRAVPFFVHSDAEDLAGLVALVDQGDLVVDVAERVPLAELPAVHARADAGRLRGKVVVLAPAR